MNQEIITATRIQEFCQHLELEEKSQATVSKYDRDVKAFVRFLADSPFTKEIVIAYKNIWCARTMQRIPSIRCLPA